MILDVAQSMALLILALIAVIVLLGILVIIHNQTRRMAELEMRMRAMDKLEVPQPTEPNQQ